MSSPSPGPGWWLASDGEWYPQKWEYKAVWSYDPVIAALAKQVQEAAEQLGQQGWEMVSAASTQLNTMVCYFKRPLKP